MDVAISFEELGGFVHLATVTLDCWHRPGQLSSSCACDARTALNSLTADMPWVRDPAANFLQKGLLGNSMGSFTSLLQLVNIHLHGHCCPPILRRYLRQNPKPLSFQLAFSGSCRKPRMRGTTCDSWRGSEAPRLPCSHLCGLVAERDVPGAWDDHQLGIGEEPRDLQGGRRPKALQLQSPPRNLQKTLREGTGVPATPNWRVNPPALEAYAACVQQAFCPTSLGGFSLSRSPQSKRTGRGLLAAS